MRLSIRPARLRRPALFWALAGGSLLIAHDAVFFAQVGPGEPLARALRGGSHAYWAAASAVLLAFAVLAAFVVALRLRALHRHARVLVGAAPRTDGARARLRLVPRLWVRILAVVALGFLVQENVEHLGQHGHLIGLSALSGPEYPLALPVLAAITLVAATIGAAVLGTERELLATIAAAARYTMRAARIAVRPPLQLVVGRRSLLSNPAAGRAPPPGIATSAIA